MANTKSEGASLSKLVEGVGETHNAGDLHPCTPYPPYADTAQFNIQPMEALVFLLLNNYNTIGVKITLISQKGSPLELPVKNLISLLIE